MNSQPTEHPASGWRARLELRFQFRDERTRLSHRRHQGPLVVQRAFYPEGSPCHVYIIHPPGGVVSGDDLGVDVEVGSQAHALLTTPAAGKFYRRYGSRLASLTQSLRVENGTLEWLPQENIYYPDAGAELRTIARLSGNARFIGWEIGCYGLPANRCDLGEGQVRQHFELWHDGAPVLLERLAIDRASLRARWGLAGYAALGTLLAFPADTRHLEQARAVIAQATGLSQGTEALTLACTLVDKTLCCRGYAQRADRLKRSFIDVWSALRLELFGCTATPPRIWNT